jgi:hypothetical protein
MKTLTVRLPDELVAQIDSESRARRVSKSDIVRERLSQSQSVPDPLASIADLIGSVDVGPPDLSTNLKRHLRTSGYGRKRPR